MSFKGVPRFQDQLVRKAAEIIMDIDGTESYGANTGKNIDMTASHISQVVKKMEAAGLITTKLDGRIKKILLTKKGKAVRENLLEIKRVFKNGHTTEHKS